MMPAQNKTIEISASAIEHLNMKDFTAKKEENKNFSSSSDALNTPEELLDVSNYENCDTDGSEVMCQILSSDDHGASLLKHVNLSNPDISSNIRRLKLSDPFSNRVLQNEKSDQYRGYSKKSIEEIETLQLKELQLLLENLSHTVEAVSSELVQLLLENDALQQESDARNIAIEQLLKMTVKNNENEPKPIQMSVVISSDDESDIN